MIAFVAATTFRDWVSDFIGSDFARSLLLEVLGGLAAGGVVAFAAWRWIERRERRLEELDLVERVLIEVERELGHNRQMAETLVENLPDAIAYPLFDVNGWTILTQAPVLKALSAETLAVLMKTYNRFRTSNEHHAFVHKLLVGPEWAAAQVLFAQHRNSDELEQFRAVQQDQVEHLRTRVQELLDIIPGAIGAVDLNLASIRARRAA